MHTKAEIIEEIEMLEQKMNRSCTAESNLLESARDELQEIADEMRDDQLADCDHLFYC